MNLTIGKLAKQANVSIETIRYYQRIGLLDVPVKPFTGYRQYPAEAISRLHFIKRAQQAGFTLKEILELLSLDNNHCKDVQKLAKEKCRYIDQQLKDLTAIRNVLAGLIEGCQQHPLSQHCSLIEALSDEKNTNI